MDERARNEYARNFAFGVHLAAVLLPEVADEVAVAHLVEERGGEVRPAGVLSAAVGKLRVVPAESEFEERPPQEAEGRSAQLLPAEDENCWYWLTEPLSTEEVEAMGTVIQAHDEKYPWT